MPRRVTDTGYAMTPVQATASLERAPRWTLDARCGTGGDTECMFLHHRDFLRLLGESLKVSRATSYITVPTPIMLRVMRHVMRHVTDAHAPCPPGPARARHVRVAEPARGGGGAERGDYASRGARVRGGGARAGAAGSA